MAATHAPLTSATVATTDPREIVWLPLEVNAQQVVSAAGRANPVLRVTTFSDFRIEPNCQTTTGLWLSADPVILLPRPTSAAELGPDYDEVWNG